MDGGSGRRNGSDCPRRPHAQPTTQQRPLVRLAGHFLDGLDQSPFLATQVRSQVPRLEDVEVVIHKPRNGNADAVATFRSCPEPCSNIVSSPENRRRARGTPHGIIAQFDHGHWPCQADCRLSRVARPGATSDCPRSNRKPWFHVRNRRLRPIAAYHGWQQPSLSHQDRH